MKIISKFKDYYDYLTGIYGIDPKLILDRRDMLLNTDLTKNSKYLLKIGTHVIDIFVDEFGNIIYGEDLKSICNNDNWHKNYITIKSYNRHHYIYFDYFKLTELELSNDKQAVSLYHFRYFDTRRELLKGYPNLLKLGLNKICSAKNAWIYISNFLSKELTKSEKQVPIGDDNLRLLSHGYDLKTSFRGKV